MIKKHFVPHRGKQSQFFAPILNCSPLPNRNVSIAPSRGRQMFFLVQPSPFTRHLALLINNEHSLTLPQVSLVVLLYCSDFVTNSYGELSCEKSRVPVKKKEMSLKLEVLGPLCNQTVNLKTDSKTLYYSILKLQYSPSILKHNIR